MSVVILLAGVGPDRFPVVVSPLAELAASLHVLTGHLHHPEHASWAAEVSRAAPPAFRAGLLRFAPLWTALRWRAFYPGLGTAAPAAPLPRLPLHLFQPEPRGPRTPRPTSGSDGPQGEVEKGSLHRFAELTAFTCASGYHGFDFGRVLHDPTQASALRQAASRLPEPHLRLAEDLLRDPEALRADVLDFLGLCTPVLLIPTRYGAPHLLVKNEPGLPPVVHFPVETPEVGVTLARSRLLALTDPRRVRLCRLIARQAMTTADLADRLSMTRPQVSRHLRVLRDLGLVRVERHGRYVLYGLDLTAVERIGRDVATALQY